jgi:hypothetical protein
MTIEQTDQPAPEITAETKLLSIDVESNGLHGKAFAVGAVVMQLDGTVIEEFSARCPIEGELDLWVKKNVLPVLEEFPETHRTARAMRDDFWEWYKTAKDTADYMMVDNGYPVEARFLISCQDDELEDRYWDHSFPLLDLSSIFITIGVKPLAVRYKFVAEELGDAQNLQHNPRFDAWVSALSAAKALKLAGRY